MTPYSGSWSEAMEPEAEEGTKAMLAINGSEGFKVEGTEARRVREAEAAARRNAEIEAGLRRLFSQDAEELLRWGLLPQ